MQDIKFVAELTINHLGMVAIAKQMIKSAKNSGAQYIKLKLKSVDKYYKDESKQWRNLNFKEYRKSLELSKDDFHEIDTYCKKLNIQWFSTIHDKESLDFIKSFNVPFYKIASIDVSNESLLNDVILVCQKEDKPIIVSVGGKDLRFIDSLLSTIQSANIKCYLLHTVSIYPTPIGQSNINFIDILNNKYANDKTYIGYSGHEIGYSPTIFASMKNIKMIERHFTLSKEWKIHHIASALTPDDFKNMVTIITDIKTEKDILPLEYHKDELNFLEGLEYK